jgi:hypothetical protein
MLNFERAICQASRLLPAAVDCSDLFWKTRYNIAQTQPVPVICRASEGLRPLIEQESHIPSEAG